MLGDVLPALPDRIKQQLFDAFDLAMLYHKKDNQVTCWAIITPSTPAALAAIIADSETPTSPAKIILRICHANLGRSIAVINEEAVPPDIGRRLSGAVRKGEQLRQSNIDVIAKHQ